MIHSIKTLRVNKNLKQTEAAALLGLKDSTYRSYELLDTMIPFNIAVLMARLYDVEIRELNDIMVRQKGCRLWIM